MEILFSFVYILKKFCEFGNIFKQAGAELCQAQEMLGLARNCDRLPLI